MVLEGLRNAPGIILPKISSLTKPVFNRLPLLFEDTNRLSSMQHKLWAQGIETSRMYLRPLHHVFKLGYAKNDFPNAVYVASHLLTLPIHPGLSYIDIQRMINIIRG